MSLKSIARQINGKPVFNLLMTGGLVIGFSVFSILVSIVKYQLSYDDFWKGGDCLYKVGLEQYQGNELQFNSARNYRAVTDLLVEEFPEVQGRARLFPDIATAFAEGNQIQDVAMYYADTNIFSILPCDILYQEGGSLFQDIHSCVINGSLALALFGTKDVIGRRIELNEGWMFYVSAVFETIPRNSHLDIDFLVTRASLLYYYLNFDNNTGQLREDPSFRYVEPGPYDPASWEQYRGYSYIKVRKGTDMELLEKKAEALLADVDLPGHIENATIKLTFQPIDQVHLRSDYPDEMKATGSMFRIYMLILIGVAVLVISWINFLNMFIIEFQEKGHDNLVRKIFGASSGRIIFHTLQKGFYISMLSALFSGIIIFLFAKLKDAHYTPDQFVIFLLAGLVLVSTFLTVFIPLFGEKVAGTVERLRGEITGGRKGKSFRRIIIGIQFSASIFLISSTLILLLQMNYLRRSDLGFDPATVIYSFTPMTMNARPDVREKLVAFRDAVERIPAVTQFSVSSSIPGKPVAFPGEYVYRKIPGHDYESFVYKINMDASYLELFGLNLIAGRDFREDNRYDTDEVILNRSAAISLGFRDMIEVPGNFIQAGGRKLKVIGVVEDYHHLSMKSAMMPLIFYKSLQWRYWVGYYSFKLVTPDLSAVDRIKEAWTDIYPAEEFIFTSMEEAYFKQYAEEKAFGNSFLTAAILAVIVSCLGLFGFAKYITLARTREIGIRKTFGATSSRILISLQSETMVIILLAALVGTPVAVFIIREWLANFAYHIDLSWWMFLPSPFIVMLFALGTVQHQTWKAARTDPSELLRYE